MNKAELFFEAGADGGGEALYRNPDGTFFTSGSSGGMLDEEEDPIISWRFDYPDFQNYWEDFIRKNGNFWPFLYPLFIHPEAIPLIQKALDSLDEEKKELSAYQINNWRMAMEKGHKSF